MRLHTQEMDSGGALSKARTSSSSFQQNRESGSLGGMMGVSLINVENMSGMLYILYVMNILFIWFFNLKKWGIRDAKKDFPSYIIPYLLLRKLLLTHCRWNICILNYQNNTFISLGLSSSMLLMDQNSLSDQKEMVPLHQKLAAAPNNIHSGKIYESLNFLLYFSVFM